MADDKRLRRFPLNHVREQEFYATARKLQAERASATKIVDAALGETRRHAWHELVARPELLTYGALERLDAIVGETMTREPMYALAVAELGIVLSAVIPEANYPAITLAQTRAAAWKNRGKILSYLARYDEALKALATAERFINSFPTLEHDRAVILLNVAITYLEMERYAESLAILAACKKVFEAHGDDSRLLPTAFYEGVILQRMHKYREARETYLLLLATSSNISTETLAALHQTIGLCSIELGDYDAAETSLKKAIALHKELGQPLDAVKGEHGRGLLLIRRGFLAEGVGQLRTVRHQYLKASLAEEAGLCGLEMVGALLALGRTENAEALARTIMNEFLAASLNGRAITALGYLSEAIAARKAPPSLAADVRQYVLSLRMEPEREFENPPG